MGRRPGGCDKSEQAHAAARSDETRPRAGPRSQKVPPTPPPPNTHTHTRAPRRIEDIDDKAVALADSAQKFKNAGTQLKRNMRCRYYKIMLLFGFLVAAILAAIIAYFVQKDKESKQQ